MLLEEDYCSAIGYIVHLKYFLHFKVKYVLTLQDRSLELSMSKVSGAKNDFK